jgi:transposase
MRMRVRKYSAEYRARAVKLCSESNRPITAVARDLGIEYGTLWDWMKKAGKAGGSVPIAAPSKMTAATTSAAAMEAELERLRRELEEVKKERDFLKKAAAFFAKQHQ